MALSALWPTTLAERGEYPAAIVAAFDGHAFEQILDQLALPFGERTPVTPRPGPPRGRWTPGRKIAREFQDRFRLPRHARTLPYISRVIGPRDRPDRGPTGSGEATPRSFGMPCRLSRPRKETAAGAISRAR